ncbi:MAG: response regulator [Sandaracinaceae bacterium]|nr:response regulator [Sandaracinaceae bacterium]
MSHGNPGSVWIAEDEWLIARHMRQTLVAQGYRVERVVRTTSELLAALEPERPDVLLLDISLEARDAGLALVEREALGKHLRVVFVTAHADAATQARAHAAGCADFLVKPFTEAALVRVVANAMGAPPSERDGRSP